MYLHDKQYLLYGLVGSIPDQDEWPSEKTTDLSSMPRDSGNDGNGGGVRVYKPYFSRDQDKKTAPPLFS